MSKEMAVIALGFLVVVMPYLGIYRSWLTLLMIVVGIALTIIGFLLRGERIAEDHHKTHVTPHPKRHRAPRKPHATFEENTIVPEPSYSSDTPNIGSLN